MQHTPQKSMFGPARHLIEPAASNGNIEALRLRRDCFFKEGYLKRAKEDAETIFKKTSQKEDREYLEEVVKKMNSEAGKQNRDTPTGASSSKPSSFKQPSGRFFGSAGGPSPRPHTRQVPYARPVQTPEDLKKMKYYEALQLDVTASDNDIRKAFNKLSLKYHPDKNLDKTQEQLAALSAKLTFALHARDQLLKSKKNNLTSNKK